MTRTRIKLPHGNLKKLSEANGVPYTTLRDALDYRSNSLQAQSLRHQALTLYGGKRVKL